MIPSSAYDGPSDNIGGPPPQGNGLGIGTIGWASDGGNAYELGDTDNDGTSLVRVTMFEGKDPTVPLKAGVGQGQRLLCQVSQDIIVLPAYGSRVLVAMPGPAPRVAGHSVVIATLGNTQWQKAGNSTGGDLCIPCPLGPARILMRADGGISLLTQDNKDGSDIAFSIGADGLHAAGPFGTLDFDNFGFRIIAGGGPSLIMSQAGGLPFPMNLLAGQSITISAGTIKLDAAQIWAGVDDPSSNFMPVPVYNDSTGLPAPTPLLGVLLNALAPYFASVESILGVLATQPQYTGVSAAQIIALQQAKAGVAAAFSASASTLTSTILKVAHPGP